MKHIISISLLFLCSTPAFPQPAKDVFVDKAGVMRWGTTKEEVKGFGVNYTAMFAHAYKTATRQNISLEKAIDDDVYHFARLGFDLYRIHVWDTEISDTLGNLLSNDHLRLFDYALSRMKERGMNFIITPIAFWGNGWPEPDEKTSGFSAKYWKDGCLTNENAIKAQENYLAQFLNHVNQYTGVAFKNEPAMIAFEVSNEPHHQESAEKVTAFIKRMIAAMRSTGCKKPILYNVSHSIHLSEAYAAAGIQGGTFQWYPTGLGSRHELGGNLLLNVDKYKIPFGDSPSYTKLAKTVYEFDAADVGRSYIYPAMARSFREAGIQVATHFAYDPTYMADVNTEYGTHYMNLAFAPQKALSLKIASAVFHRIPMKKYYGGYPANTTFDNFHVSYEGDLAEMVTEKEFFYTNHTTTAITAPEKLEHVAGWGDSPVVQYEGTGAYFLDRIQPGVWRLEVMPDAVWISDPFAPASPRKQVAVINRRPWPIGVALPDLGKDFKVSGISIGNAQKTNADGTKFIVSPGTYLLEKSGVFAKLKPEESWKNIVLNEFVAPPTTVKKTYVLHTPVSEMTAGVSHVIEATIISPNMPASVELQVLGKWGRPEPIVMARERNYQYRAEIPAASVTEGFVRYYIVIRDGSGTTTYPVALPGEPREWDFYDRRPYEVRCVAAVAPIYLFDATTDEEQVSRLWLSNSVVRPTEVPGKTEVTIPVEKLFVPDPENRSGPEIADYSMRYFFGKKIEGRKDGLTGKTKIIISARALNDKQCPLQIALIMRDGSSYGALVTLGPTQNDYAVSLSDFKPVNVVTLPRPYPTFLPYFFERTGQTPFDLSKIETIQVSIGPGLSKESQQQAIGFVLRTVRLE